jgi:hypothetical protein
VADSFLDWLALLLCEGDALLVGVELGHLLRHRVTLLPRDLTTLLTGHLRDSEKNKFHKKNTEKKRLPYVQTIKKPSRDISTLSEKAVKNKFLWF